jgi:hypothetical protein
VKTAFPEAKSGSHLNDEKTATYIYLQEVVESQVLVAHTCNPSYLGSIDQEDHGSKPTPANSLGDPISKKAITKKGWWSGSRCRP